MAQLESPIAAPQNTLLNPVAMYLGTDDDGYNSPFQGMFCDLRFYGGALSAAQVATMYAPATRWDLYASAGTPAPAAPTILTADSRNIGGVGLSRTPTTESIGVNQSNISGSTTTGFAPSAVALDGNQVNLWSDANGLNTASPVDVPSLPSQSFGSLFGATGFSTKSDEDTLARFSAATTQFEDAETGDLNELMKDSSKNEEKVTNAFLPG